MFGQWVPVPGNRYKRLVVVTEPPSASISLLAEDGRKTVLGESPLEQRLSVPVDDPGWSPNVSMLAELPGHVPEMIQFKIKGAFKTMAEAEANPQTIRIVFRS
jgi:hypothetical protein